jgi:L-lysine 2,3-aminomutase
MWVEQFKNRFISPEILFQKIPHDYCDPISLKLILSEFSVAAPKYYFDLIDWDDPNDPIFLQIIPSSRELKTSKRESPDPLHEKSHSPIPGLIHKYRGRVLILASDECAVHCRFCFRKASHCHARSTNEDFDQFWTRILFYLKNRTDINEVILSGGDPLVLQDQQLDFIFQTISKVAHIKIIRIHSRIPVVLPQRVTSSLIASISNRVTTWVVVHFNHAAEMTGEAAEACASLINAGIPVLNQTVLLRGINDSVKSLSELNLALIENRIKPYYLHILDPTPGTSHFYVSVNKARQLITAVKKMLPGYAIPLIAKELPERDSKITYQT